MHQGLNRLTWDLRRDDFARPVTGEEQAEESEFRPSGILALPGAYRLMATFGDEERSASITVLADPREAATPEERRLKYQALLAAGELRESVADAISLIYRVRKDLTASLEAEKRVSEGSAKSRGADEKDSDADTRLQAQARDIRRSLTELEEQALGPEGDQGHRVLGGSGVESDRLHHGGTPVVMGCADGSADRLPERRGERGVRGPP